MTKNGAIRSIFLCFILLTACNTVTPEKYFDVAVLNVNLINNFAGNGLFRELESPSVKLSEKTGDAEPMQRSEIIQMKISTIETNFEKVKNLKETPDTKEMLAASLALYNYVIPVYKKEYVQLAELFDRNAGNEEIQSVSNSIHDKYYSHFSELYDKLVSAGKIYAEKNAIKVNW
ncbi:MAG: hypothetical protein ABI462_01985 [Ignavibacteria bacterium]